MKIAAINSETWYPNHIGFELPVLRAYVKAVEEQIKNSANWRKKAEVVETIEIPDEGIYHETSVVDGLDDTTYSFETVFDEYFPQLQRQSALIVLYSFLERETGHLTELCQKVFKAGGGPTQSGQGSTIARYRRYLETEIGLAISEADPAWLAIDDGIRVVRNQIVHNNAKAPDPGTDDSKKLEAYLAEHKTSDLIAMDRESIVLKPGYLNYVLSSFDAFFTTLNNAIKAKP